MAPGGSNFSLRRIPPRPPSKATAVPSTMRVREVRYEWLIMSDNEFSTSMSVPLDSDGFLRRECPTCEREFKWLPSNNDEGATRDPSGYYCPYCGVQANDGWLTQAQADAVRATVMRDVVGPTLDDFGKNIQGSSSSMIRFEVKREPVPEPPELTEDDDMRRVDFACHPSEPLKVLDDWNGPVHCLICGTSAP